MSAPRPSVRVLVVEDSGVQRAALVRALTAEGDVEVVGEAGDVDTAVAATVGLEPDVVTMDLGLPGARGAGLGGLEAIARIMARRPTPILVLSVHAPDPGQQAAIEALAAGALDALPKPREGDTEAASQLRRRVRVLRRVSTVRRHVPAPAASTASAGARAGERTTGSPVIALAASTGGPVALATVVRSLTALDVPVLVVQHLHPRFVGGFAAWLGAETAMPVELATDGGLLRPGVAVIAPPDTHLRLAAGRRMEVGPEPATGVRPSADELLTSVARHAGPDAIAALLTGMGSDGARGLLAIREAGGRTFAQDGATAVVDGMPRAARELGAVGPDDVLALERLGPAIVAAVTDP